MLRKTCCMAVAFFAFSISICAHDGSRLRLQVGEMRLMKRYKGWAGETKIYTSDSKDSKTGIAEDLCVPSEEDAYKKLMRESAAGKD